MTYEDFLKEVEHVEGAIQALIKIDNPTSGSAMTFEGFNYSIPAILAAAEIQGVCPSLAKLLNRDFRHSAVKFCLEMAYRDVAAQAAQ